MGDYNCELMCNGLEMKKLLKFYLLFNHYLMSFCFEGMYGYYILSQFQWLEWS
jgi:hypothetical protein